jgi:hypothetical protein
MFDNIPKISAKGNAATLEQNQNNDAKIQLAEEI